MVNRKKTLIIAAFVTVFIFSSLAISVYAQSTGMLDSLLSPLGRLENVYAKFGQMIDAIIYFIIFFGLAQYTLGQRFGYSSSKGGKAIVVGIALVLSLGLAIFEKSAGFNITSFGSAAALILIALMGFALWEALKEFQIPCLGTPGTSALVYILMYSSVQATVPNIMTFMMVRIPIIAGLLSAVFILAVIVLIVLIIRCASGFFGGGSASTPPPPGNNGGGGNGGSQNRPPGQLPPPSPSSFKPDDPPTTKTPPPGLNPKAPGPKPKAPLLPKQPKIPDDTEIYIDLSPDFNPIRSQDELGACTAFAATSMFEYIMHVGFKKPKKYLAPLFLWYKTRKTIGAINTDTGPYTCTVPMKNLLEDGVCFEDIWKFESSATHKWRAAPDMPAESDAVQKKIIEFRGLDRQDPDQWVHELLEKNPINIGVLMPVDMGSKYPKKFYDNFSQKSFAGGHAMVIVGYHSHYPYKGQGVKAFKIRNSWGPDFADNGYVWVPEEVLKRMVDESPIVITGWKSENIGKVTVTGKAVFDDKQINIPIEKTGFEIYSHKEIPVPDHHEFVVGLMAQRAGNIIPLGETIVRPKDSGKFKIQIETDFASLEKLTVLPNHPNLGKFFKGIDFSKLPAGLVVYKRNLNGEIPEYYFHITNLEYSKAGRGGEGRTHPENPCSALLHKGIPVSGIPLTFDAKHTTEANVIIPVVHYPWMKEEQVQFSQKAVDALKKANKFATKEQAWVGTEMEALKTIVNDITEGKFELASNYFKNVGRSETRVQKFSKKLEKELDIIISEMHDAHGEQCRVIKRKMQALSRNILLHTSRYTGDFKKKLDRLREILKKLKKPEKMTEAQIEAMHKEKAEFVTKFVHSINEVMTWLGGLDAQLVRLHQFEEKVLKEANLQ